MRILFTILFLFSSTLILSINGGLNLINKIIIFGDSLTDNGNVYKLSNYTWPIVPPYYQGRFCNGPNWFDRLSITDKSNYAYGSATTDNNFVQGLTKLNTLPVPGIRQQIAMYFNDTSNSSIDYTHTLYIMWAAGNDLIFNSSVTIPSIMNSLMNSVRDLLAVGAKNILIFNQPPIQSFPYFSVLNQTATFSMLTIQANTNLQTSIDAIQKNYTNSTIQIFDVNTLITKVIANQSIPFTNTAGYCWDTLNLTTVAILCDNPSKYVFIDDFHFSNTTHQLIADSINSLLSYNGCLKKEESLNILLVSQIILIFSAIILF
ncbi:unnamed protein product [Adineta steineri]|uniref:Uncharacterized protein n=1 Tax=Adineta steineri TaxID=433720 RepID=A0A819DVW6_9BILA|nr:unnamed protein product [Adineta steineri]CAF3840064.1 unnamed protein product [Adineta steineri]